MEDLDRFTACLWDTTGATRHQLEAARRTVHEAHPGAGIVETCQRIEAFSLNGCGCPAPQRREGRPAVDHLAAVAAGLESAVLGEFQVLGQVRTGIAPIRPRAAWLDVPIAAARRLRAEAQFTATTGEMLDAGLRLAGTTTPGSLLVIGAGALGRDVIRRGAAAGIERVVVASRTDPGLAEAGGWIPFGRLAMSGHFDVVAGCLGSGAGELTGDDLPRATVYIDLGSPPNFGRSVRPLIALREIVQALRNDDSGRRRREALRTRLTELIDAGMAGRSEDSASPVGRMRKEIEALRVSESLRIARLHPELSKETIDAITRTLVNRLLHTPSERLREMGDPELAERLADLFVQPAVSL